MIRQHVVTLVAVIYYTERLQSKITKGRGPEGDVQGHQVQRGRAVLVESHRCVPGTRVEW